MYHIVQENCFREANYDTLIDTLNRLQLEYEIIKVKPFIDDIEFNTKRTDVFVWGAVKLARVAKKYNWHPGSLLNDNHDFLVYKEHYKDNLFNYNSKILTIDEFVKSPMPDGFFARPTTDGKAFTGKVFNSDDFIEFIMSYSIPAQTLIQVSGIKQIFNEVRCWIVDGKVITASQYKVGYRVISSEYTDEDGLAFCQSMVDKFQLADAFVMDICRGADGWKIMECGCINSAGFYAADMNKLVIALEQKWTPLESDPSRDERLY